MMQRTVVFLFIALGVFAFPAKAQVPRADGLAPVAAFRQTVVVTAAVTPVELGAASRKVTVVTREQIAQLPARSVADVLRLAASVDVRARGVRGVQTDFAVRGANFGQMLVLVDGVRLNDAQSGHHNGDIPVPLDAVERIEILYGAGSSIFGADAFGGTVNVITRAAAPTSLTVEGGSFDLAGAAGQVGFERGAVRQLFSGSADRSTGFMYDRDFKTAIVRSRTSFGTRGNVSVSYLWKEFGAFNFYGGHAPSREWTNQTLVAADYRLAPRAGWAVSTNASYRTHGDRFLFNQERPQLSDNRHRTHAALTSVVGSRRVRDVATLALGVEGGAEWIRSSNLGNHSTLRISAFGEWRQELGADIRLDAALRVDRYDEFGASWNPSVGASWWALPALRVRGSAGRAFRVPTFTERFYSDPAHLARPETGPERAWAGDAGLDLFLRGGWLAHVTIFGRADHDVIDWLRPTPAVRWRTYNIRAVDTAGVEIGIERSFASGAFARAAYTRIDVTAAAVDQLSKYVLDYAPHSVTAAAAVPLPGAIRLVPRIEFRQRSRPTGTSKYVLLDIRAARRLGRVVELVVEGTNLLDAEYQEIAGVAMPGRAGTVSLVFGAR